MLVDEDPVYPTRRKDDNSAWSPRKRGSTRCGDDGHEQPETEARFHAPSLAEDAADVHGSVENQDETIGRIA